jgi:2-phospho-L-lactate guanylyltransferase (CobY/MobA/RfbA family)
MMSNAARVVLRAVTATASGVAAVVMATSQETSTNSLFIFGVELEAKFQYAPALV